MKEDEKNQPVGWERRNFLKLMGAMGGASLISSLPLSLPAATKDVYPAEDINWVCYSSAGGGYDLTARSSAPFLTKALREVSPNAKGGNVKVTNMTGGAGAKAAYYLFNDARPDGYTIGDINRGSFYNPLCQCK